MKPGDIVEGKYELIRLIGEGGMGAVYEARHRVLGRELAVKVLLPELCRQPGMAERFLLEARAAAAIGSEHIVQITDAGKTPDGAPFIVMERLTGSDLGELMRQRGAFSPDEAARFVVQICRALGAAHARGIIHRDLKPENLFVTVKADGTEWIKVLDFGIAKVLATVTGHVSRLTATGSMLGTPHYMAPEQLRESKDVDSRADIYSCGVILYELLTGRLPFQARTFGDLIIQVMTTEPPPPSALRPGLDRALDPVVLRAMAKDPAHRFATMGELGAALEPFAATSPASVGGAEVAAPMADPPPEVRRAPIPPTAVLSPPSTADETADETTEPEPATDGPRAPMEEAAAADIEPASPESTFDEDEAPPDVGPPTRATYGEDPRPPGTSLLRRWVVGGSIGAAAALVVALIASSSTPARPPEPQPVEPVEATGSEGDSLEHDCREGLGRQCLALGDRYAKGDGAEGQSWKMASAYYSKACDRDVDEGCRKLLRLYEDGHIEDDVATIERVCKAGGAGACRSLAVKHAAGDGVPRSDERAFELFDAACDVGDGESCYDLGELLAAGRGTSKSEAKAASAYARACEARHFAGCLKLGDMYSTGRGVSRSDEKAITYYRRACNGGNKLGCHNVAWAYEKGVGIAKNVEHAAELYGRTCDLGLGLSCNNLGWLYVDGRGVRRSYEKAASLFGRACSGDEPMYGCHSLAWMYEEGRGVTRDRAEAARLYRLSCSAGNEESCARAKSLGGSL